MIFQFNLTSLDWAHFKGAK